MHPEPWETFQHAVSSGEKGAAEQAFNALHRTARDEMVRFAQWCVRRHNPGLVPGFVLNPEEVVDDAFSELWLKCEQIKGHPKGWLLGVIRQRLAFDVSRVRNEDKLKPEVQLHLNGINKQRKCSVSREKRRALREAINDLPNRMRAVVIALYYRRESVATTAALLGITENTVTQTKRRALKKLRDAL